MSKVIEYPRRIRVRPLTRANLSIQLTLIALTLLTLYSFTTFDSRGLNLAEATSEMFRNFQLLFFEPRLKNVTALEMVQQLFVTAGLGWLTTVFGAIIAFFSPCWPHGTCRHPG